MFNGPVVAKLPWSMCQIMAPTITRDNPVAASGMRNWYIRNSKPSQINHERFPWVFEKTGNRRVTENRDQHLSLEPGTSKPGPGVISLPPDLATCLHSTPPHLEGVK